MDFTGKTNSLIGELSLSRDEQRNLLKNQQKTGDLKSSEVRG